MRRFLLALILNVFIAVNCFAAAATMYVTPAGAGNKSGSSWSNAMGLTELIADLSGADEAGDIYYLAGGTYTLTGSSAFYANGTDTNPISIIGVNSGTTNEPPTSSDWAYGDNRPLITQGGYYWNTNDRAIYFIRNLRSSGSGYFGWNLISAVASNIKATCTNATGGCIYSYPSGLITNCEATNSKADGNAFTLNGGAIIASYAHDSAYCFSMKADSNGPVSIINSVADTCSTTGIYADITAYTQKNIIGNVIYSGGTGIDFGTGTGNATSTPAFAINNVIDNFTTGMAVSAASGFAISNYNILSNNTTDYSNVVQGPNDLVSDITFNDAANGDFTITSSSGVHLAAGLKLDTNTGVVGAYKQNIGVDQDDNTVAGGGGGGAGHLIIQ
jgi:hypothetical protein